MINENKDITAFSIFVIIFLCSIFVYLGIVEHNLTIKQLKPNIIEKSVSVVPIKGKRPGPTLFFEGDDRVRIHVYNRMDASTFIQGHNVLISYWMDGVTYMIYPPIVPNSTFTYEFPIRQTRIYGYQSHSELQEQSGLYGSIILKSRRQCFAVHEDHAVLLSDWTKENSRAVLRTLKRESERYVVQKGSRQNIFGVIRRRMFGVCLKRDLLRMPPMDIMNVVHDRFLANEKPEMYLTQTNSRLVKLRIIDGSATTFFYMRHAVGLMTIIAADEQKVESIKLDRFLIAVVETYDVLVEVPTEGTYELCATVHDDPAHTSKWLGKGKRHATPAIPEPDLYHSMGKLSFKSIFVFTTAGTMGMPDSKTKAGIFDKPGVMGAMMKIDHGQGVDGKYLKMHKMYKANNKNSDAGKHHPMHLHGHLFGMINKHGDHSPFSYGCKLGRYKRKPF